jgi:hypothetical protein
MLSSGILWPVLAGLEQGKTPNKPHRLRLAKRKTPPEAGGAFKSEIVGGVRSPS